MSGATRGSSWPNSPGGCPHGRMHSSHCCRQLRASILRGDRLETVRFVYDAGPLGSPSCSLQNHFTYLKGKRVFLYSAVSSPLDHSKRFTLFALPGRPVHSDTNSASPGTILAMLQLRAKTKSLTFPPLSIARYSFIQLSQLGASMARTKMPNLRNGNKGGFEPRLT